MRQARDSELQRGFHVLQTRRGSQTFKDGGVRNLKTKKPKSNKKSHPSSSASRLALPGDKRGIQQDESVVSPEESSALLPGLRRRRPGQGVPRHGRGQAGSPRAAAEARERARGPEERGKVHQMGRGESDLAGWVVVGVGGGGGVGAGV